MRSMVEAMPSLLSPALVSSGPGVWAVRWAEEWPVAPGSGGLPEAGAEGQDQRPEARSKLLK